MFIDQNIAKLKRKFPLIKWDMLRQLDNSESIRVEIESTRKGNSTLKVTANGTDTYIHSKYDPVLEAGRIADSLEIKPEDQNFLFFGIGLGYIIDIIKSRRPDATYSIYEPNPLVFLRFLYSRRLSDAFIDSLNNLYIEGFVEDKQLALFVFYQHLGYRIKTVVLPSYESINAEEYSEFCSRLKASISDKRYRVGTKYMLQKKWLLNTMDNFFYTARTVNIVNMSEKVFKGKPAILVASGPSLDEEIENLKRIKDEGLAYIFTAGSALFKLAKHGILPDAACALDGSSINYDIYKVLFENPENKVPLIFADMLYKEVVSSYNAKMFNVILEDDSLALHYLKNTDNSELKTVKVGPSIAIITLQILHQLQCDPIILVGQNLALKNEYYYAPGIDFHKNREAKEKIAEKDKANMLQIEDVYGNTIYTLKDLDMMRRNMEIIINYKGIDNIINTTKGGARIEGTTFTELSELMENRLNTPVADPSWFETEAEGYDIEYMREQHRHMLEDLEEIDVTIQKIEEHIEEIEKAVSKNSEKKLNNLLLKFAKVSRRLTRNNFFRTFIYPMNNLQFDLFLKSLEAIARESDIFVKGKKAVDEYRGFISDVKELLVEIRPHFEEFDMKFKSTFIGGN